MLMEKMTIKAYAVKHKMSLFNVVKLVKNGKIKSETVVEEGKEKVYIVVDEDDLSVAKEKENEAEKNEDKTLETRVAQLEAEVEALRREIEDFKVRV